jgi:hypothetical protein
MDPESGPEITPGMGMIVVNGGTAYQLWSIPALAFNDGLTVTANEPTSVQYEPLYAQFTVLPTNPLLASKDYLVANTFPDSYGYSRGMWLLQLFPGVPFGGNRPKVIIGSSDVTSIVLGFYVD